MNGFGKVELRPDWITFTGKYKVIGGQKIVMPTNSHEAHAVAFVVLSELMQIGWQDGGLWKEVKAPKYYRYALMSELNGILIAFGGERQGWLVQLQGVWWSKYTNWRVMGEGVIKHKLKVTRFDYSITLQPTHAIKSWAAYLGAMVTYLAENEGAGLPVVHWPYAPTELKTAYLASRKSAKFVRIYDKQYWVDENAPAIRVEGEYKKDAAYGLFEGWMNDERQCVFDILNFSFQDYKHWPELFYELKQGTKFEKIRSTVPQPPPDRVAWFENIVKSAFKKYAAEYPASAENWAESAINFCMGEIKDVWHTDFEG